ncbi:luciferase-like domain-containing protein [Aspergillus pseudonomiae]|nr:luciferase-like domain-containing protein [Aspergillus pseudonomiae]
MRYHLVYAFAAVVPLCAAADIYVSPSGSDTAAGTIEAPLLSIQSAVDKATAGSTIYLREGTYSPTTNIQITKSGTASAPYVLRAYEGEKVTIDGEELPGTPAELDGSLANEDRGVLHIQDAEYWEFYDLELINGPYGVYARDSSNNHYERIITRKNYETGFQLEGASSNNSVYYLDSYLNRDPRKNGESADGFACKEGSGEGNVLRGARLWNNVDDGLDLWEFKSAVTIEDTISYGNGYNRWDFSPFEGDGNGYKLGGGDEADIGPANHVITNCIAFGNSKDGFTDNSQPGDFTLTRNTAWNNAKVGFKFGTAVATLSQNIAAANGESPTSLSEEQVSTGNSWDGSETWDNSSFVSVDATLVQGARNADGTIDPSDFLLPKSGEEIGATTACEKKPWILNAFAMFSPGHLSPGLWKHPQDRAGAFLDLSYWIELAKVLEKGKFHGLFLADHLGIYDVYKGPGNREPALLSGAQFPIGDPFLLISAMASVTTSLSFGITASTTYETSPYALARKFSTLDHLTRGRVGWNIVTSFLDSAAKAYGMDEQIPHDERYARADEYMELTYKLWEGTWRDGAVVKDPKTGVYSDPNQVRAIEHHGKYFKSTAASQLPASRQRTPLLFQAGASSAGKRFAAKHSEVMFLPGLEPEKTKAVVDDMRKQLAEVGRPPDSIKFIAGILVIVDETDEKAQAKYEEYLAQSDLEGVATLFGGWTSNDLSKFDDDEDFSFTAVGGIQSLISSWSKTVPNSNGLKWTKRRVLQELALGGAHPRAIGSPSTVADILQRWVDVAGVDGFNFSYAVSPGTFEDMIEYLFPELRRRGVIWDDYEVKGGSARENYFQDGLGSRLREGHPGREYAWN